MRVSEFWECMDTAFGPRGRPLAADLSLVELRSRTAVEALDADVEPRRIWEAICSEMELPERYRHLHRIDPKDL